MFSGSRSRVIRLGVRSPIHTPARLTSCPQLRTPDLLRVRDIGFAPTHSLLKGVDRPDSVAVQETRVPRRLRTNTHLVLISVESYMAATTIIVQSRSGHPVRGARVCLGFHGPTRGMSDTAYTDSDGRAVIVHSSGGRATVYVNGHDQGSMQTPGRFAATV